MNDKRLTRVAVARFDSLAPSDAAPGEAIVGGGRTERLFAGPRKPLHARLHHLEPGARLTWEAGDSGYLAYLWEGAVLADGVRLETGSSLIIEHRAAFQVEATGEGATILVFNPPVAEGSKAGGHVHLLPADRVPRKQGFGGGNVGAAIFADADCPTCDLWLHENSYVSPGYLVPPHHHDEDEIIVVTGGDMCVGQRRLGRGTALMIARNTIYSFTTGAEGLTYINFRPSHPVYVAADGAIVDEQALYRKELGRPPYLRPHREGTAFQS